MATDYATVAEYRAQTGDTSTAEGRVSALISQQSAALRATVGITDARKLTEDQTALASALVINAVSKACAPRMLDGVGDLPGASAASWSANGYSASVTYSNPTGTPYFDRAMLRAFKRSLGTVSARFAYPYYGGSR